VRAGPVQILVDDAGVVHCPAHGRIAARGAGAGTHVVAGVSGATSFAPQSVTVRAGDLKEVSLSCRRSSGDAASGRRFRAARLLDASGRSTRPNDQRLAESHLVLLLGQCADAEQLGQQSAHQRLEGGEGVPSAKERWYLIGPG